MSPGCQRFLFQSNCRWARWAWWELLARPLHIYHGDRHCCDRDHQYDSQGSCWSGFVLIISNSGDTTSQNSANSLSLPPSTRKAASWQLSLCTYQLQLNISVKLFRYLDFFSKFYTNLNRILKRKYFLFLPRKTYSPLWLSNISQFTFQMFCCSGRQ